jgi:hypothetical protein
MITIHNSLLVSSCLHLLAANQRPVVLEIGTFDGANARILIAAVPEVLITTYDVSPADPRLRSHVNDNFSSESLKAHYCQRLSNTTHERISYIERSSSTILLRSDKSSLPNIIWVDGDHTYPQVAFDIMTGISMLSDNHAALMLCDDVYLDGSNPTLQCLKSLRLDAGLEIILFQKRPVGSKYVALVAHALPASFLPS